MTGGSRFTSESKGPQEKTFKYTQWFGSFLMPPSLHVSHML